MKTPRQIFIVLITSTILVSSLKSYSQISNLDYIESAELMVSKVLVKEADQQGWKELALCDTAPVQLIPASDDFARLLSGLNRGCFSIQPENPVVYDPLGPGRYTNVRLLYTGTVILKEEAIVTDDLIFSSNLGNLASPRSENAGITIEFEHPLVVDQGLSPQLNIELDLSRSFVFDKPASGLPGVSEVTILSNLEANNVSESGRITFKVLRQDSTNCDDQVFLPEALVGAKIAIEDVDGNKLEIESDLNGLAQLEIPASKYTIDISAEGREPVRLDNIQVLPGNEIVIDEVVLLWSPDTPGSITLNLLRLNEYRNCASPSGSPLKGVNVRVKDSNGQKLSAITDPNGNVTFKLSPSIYTFYVWDAANRNRLGTITNVEICAGSNLSLIEPMIRENASTAYDPNRAHWLATLAEAGGWEWPVDEVVSRYRITTNDLYFMRYFDDSYYGNINCWLNYDSFNYANIGAQAKIGYNNQTGDIVVVFMGTDGADEKDRQQGGKIGKVRWYFRNNVGEINGADYYDNAVHRGWYEQYLTLRDDIMLAIDKLRNEDIKGESFANNNPRIYFTGHSAGGGMATMAALDLSKWLIHEFGFEQDNIIMYSFGSPKSLSEDLANIYSRIVTNAYAIVAKDDWAPYYPPFSNTDINLYKHIDNLRVINSNIIEPGPPILNMEAIEESIRTFDYEVYLGFMSANQFAYANMGAARIVPSNGAFYEYCSDSFDGLLGPLLPGHEYGAGLISRKFQSRGHEMLQYVRRLETITENDIPKIFISINDFGYIQLNWQGGIQGPCDKVGLSLGKQDSPPLDFNDVTLNYWQWATERVPNGRWLTLNGLGEEEHSFTNRNSYVTTLPIDITGLTDYWIGYYDDFGNLLDKRWFKNPYKIEIFKSTFNNTYLYPNGVQDVLNISEQTFGQSDRYSVFNLAGISVMSGVLDVNAINVSSLQSGIYILKISTKEGVISRKFIKE